MHQILFRLGLPPDTARELTALPMQTSDLSGGGVGRERERRGRKRKGEERREREGSKYTVPAPTFE